jgi:hypothetical protein
VHELPIDVNPSRTTATLKNEMLDIVMPRYRGRYVMREVQRLERENPNFKLIATMTKMEKSNRLWRVKQV